MRTGLEASMFSLGQQSMNSKQSLSLYREKHANAIKQESIRLLKAKKKQDAREMKQMKERSRQIKAGQERIREKTDRMAAEKWAAVRQQKDEAIKQEIIKIGAKDSEAKKLERYEQRILRRLRQTH